MSVRTVSAIRKGEGSISHQLAKSLEVTTNTTAEDFEEAQATIRLAIFGDGVYNREVSQKHTITYRMEDGTVISEKEAKSYTDASFIVEVHRKDETVNITIRVDNGVMTQTRHQLEKIFN